MSEPSQQEKREAISAFLGYRYAVSENPGVYLAYSPEGELPECSRLNGRSEDQWREDHTDCLPSFWTDHNACHQAELALSDEQHRVFRDALYASAPTDNPFSQSQRLRSFISATAAQRAEAIFQAISITQPKTP